MINSLKNTTAKHYLIVLCLISQANNAFTQSLRWSLTSASSDISSSPRFTDLNKDEVLDVVLGAGIENVPSKNGVIALNGKTGEILWAYPSPTQIYTSALFQDVNGDGIDDVFIGGRSATFFAIDGATGKSIWEFWTDTKENARKASVLNFFATQWVADQNKDGYKDLLCTNGGDYLAGPKDKNRVVAKLMVISGKDGKALASAKLPEQRESYYAPHTYTNHKNQTMILFGTGGETIDGGLWEVPLEHLMKNSIAKAKLIAHDSIKGFILNSVLADINNDENLDILNARMSATLSAFDGKTHAKIWEVSEFIGYECYVTPTLGQFTGDATLDFFTIVAKGSFPEYTEFMLVILDGKTGKVAYTEKAGFNQYSPASAVDLNNDGLDEIIYIENTLLDPEQFLVVNQVKVIDLKDKSNYYVGPIRKGLSMASTPSIVDLDNDGAYELIVASSSIAPEKAQPYSIIECIDLNNRNLKINWSGYLGKYGTGIYSAE